ncbi:MAG: AraC family transcriptional regulator [Capsulimonas sp.]|jgi:AraC family transcriptional regulator|nr:AraC family transcriptional regulator [Capsulimonas sp.]
MNIPDLSWSLPLSERPDARLMAVGVHGPDRVERHRTRGYWALHLYAYQASMDIANVLLPIRPGFVSLTPPDVEAVYHFPDRSTHLCAHFAFPPSAGGARAVPAMQDLGGDYADFYKSLEEGIACFRINPERAEVRLWDLLWRLADRTAAKPEVHNNPAALFQACERIEMRLSEPIVVEALAAELGVSHNHLTRLFRKRFDTTVVGYIRQRRVDRAGHLLRSTGLPVHIVAAQVGVEDPRQFSKIVRAATGMSPTELRKSG